MIKESELSKILFIDKNKIKNNKSVFGIPLKKFINNLYNKTTIPKYSLIISVYYIYTFYNINKDNDLLLINFFKDVNIYIFTCIIISLKHMSDYSINVKNICNLINIDYKKFITTEIIILEGLNWNTLYNIEDFNKFKKFLGHCKDWFQHMD
mgnify:CR=1 FL=1